MTEEIWKPATLDPSAEVSNLGRVRNSNSWCVRKLQVVDDYNFTKDIPVAALALETFVRKRGNGESYHHKNGLTTDDRLENLEWVKMGKKGTCIQVTVRGQAPVKFSTLKKAGDFIGKSPETVRRRFGKGFVNDVSIVRVVKDREEDIFYPTKPNTADLFFGKEVVTVSSDGRVSVDGGKSWKTTSTCGGFRNVSLDFDRLGIKKRCKSGFFFQRCFGVHRLVCEAFHGPCPDLCYARHKDRDRKNNHSDNLEWVSTVVVKEEEVAPAFQGVFRRKRRKSIY